MSDRAHAFVGGAVLAAALVSCVLVKLTPAAPREMVLDPKDALIVELAITEDEQGRRVAKFTHECCACGSVHHVAVLVEDGEIEMYWWADEAATRRARWRKGLMERDPWPPSNDPWMPSDR